MKTRFWSVVLIISIVLSFADVPAATAASGACGENLTWVLHEANGELEISGSGAMTDYSYSIRTPWEIIMDRIKSVKINSGATSIGSSAFSGCSALESVTIPESVTSIGSYAFSGCSALKSVTIPNGVTSIDYFAFRGCSALESVTIPESVTSIGSYTFSGCSALKNIYYSGSYIMWNEIDGSYYLQKDGVTVHYGKENSGMCGENLTWVLHEADGELEISGSGAMTDYDRFSNWAPWERWEIIKDRIKSVKINSGATSIGDYAFYSCSNLTSVTISESVADIGVNSFRRNGSVLKDIYYEGSYMMWRKVAGLSNLPENGVTVHYGKENSGTCGENLTWVLHDADGELEISGSGAMTDYSYSSRAPWEIIKDRIKSVKINSGATSIGSYVFYDCSALESVTIPEGVTSIGSYSFGMCTALESITIPGSVTSISSYAFYDCSALGSVTIQEGVTSIGSKAFYRCAALKDIYYGGSYIMWNEIDGYNYAQNEGVTVHYGKENSGTCGENLTWVLHDADGELEISGSGAMADYSYSSRAPWEIIKERIKSVKINSGATSIGSYVFYDCSALESVTIPEGVTSIGSYSFGMCTALESITIPGSVTSIGYSAFYRCTALESITIPESVTSIGYSVFSGCSALKDIYYEGSYIMWNEIDGHDRVQNEGVTVHYGKENSGTCGENLTWALHEADGELEISGSGAMTDYSYSSRAPWEIIKERIKSVKINSGATSIGSYAFYDCSALESIPIPESVTSIGSGAFHDCSALESVTIPEGVTSIGSSAFSGCSALKSVTIPESVTSIDSYAFYDCSALESVIIPGSVTSIGYYAFYDCTALKDIYYGGSYAGWRSAAGAYTISGDTAVHFAKDSTGTCGENLTWVLHEANGELEISGSGVMTGFNNVSDAPWYKLRDRIKSVKINSGTTNISSYAFKGCSALESVTIPESVTSISEYYWAFDGCSALKNIYYSGSYIMWNKIYGSHYLQKDGVTVHYGKENSGTCGENLTWVLHEANGELEISGSGAMNDYSDSGNYSSRAPWESIKERIKSVKINGGAASIGSYAFWECTALESVTIPGSITSIGFHAFQYCSALEYVIIPEGVTSIDYYAFDDCTALRSVTIPESMETIGSAFFGCDALENIYYGDSYLKWNEITGSSGYYADITIHCAKDSAGSCGENLTWVFREADKTLEISGTGEIDIPAYMPAYVRQTEFLHRIKSVIINGGATSIKDKTFSDCTALESVTIPDSVTSIGASAFSNCTALGSVTIPDSVTGIGDSAFSGCTALKSIIIPGGVTEIGEKLFSGCSSLENIALPNGITKIGRDAFADTAFQRDDSNRDNNLLYIGKYLLDAEKNMSGKCTIKTGTEIIADFAFYGCSGITDITVPSSVKHIGDLAFGECSNAENITISDGVSTIGKGAFYNCTRLKELILPESVTLIKGYCVKGCAALKKLYVPRKAYYDAESDEFGGCYALTDLTMHGGFLRPYALANCRNLKRIYLYSATGYNIMGFDIYDPLLTYGTPFASAGTHMDIVFDGSVKEIPAFIFYDAGNGISSVTIPESVTSIGYYAFYGCKALSDIYYEGTRAEWEKIRIGQGNESLSNTYIHCSDDVFEASGECGDDAEWTLSENGLLTISGSGKIHVGKWDKEKIKNVVIRGNITAIDDKTFIGCRNLVSVDMADSICTVGTNAFSDCVSLESVRLSNAVSAIRAGAFFNCTALTDINIPAGISAINDSVFAGCTSLASLILPDSVLSIEKSAFAGCTSLENLTIPPRVSRIADYAFKDCMSLKNITIPESVKVCDNAFPGCSGLETVYWNAVSCSGSFGESNSSLRELYIGENVKKIPNCTKNKSLETVYWNAVYIDNYETYFGESGWTQSNSPFIGNTAIKKVVFGDRVMRVPDGAFWNCTSIESIIIPTSVNYIGEHSFRLSSGEVFYAGDEEQWNNIEGETLFEVVHFGEKQETANKCGDSAVWELSGDGTLTITGSGKITAGSWNSSEIKKVVIAGGITEIGEYTFGYAQSIESVDLPDTVTKIGQYAFHQCSALKSISIPQNVTEIGEKAFYGSGLTEVFIPQNVTSVGKSAFAECGGLTSAKLADGVPVSDSMFENCRKLTSISLGKGITEIGFAAFRRCGVSEMEIPDGVTLVDGCAFEYCTAMQKISIPLSVRTMREYALHTYNSLVVDYAGTKEQWNKIDYDKDLNNYASSGYLTISCRETAASLPELIASAKNNDDGTVSLEISIDAGEMPKGARVYICRKNEDGKVVGITAEDFGSGSLGIAVPYADIMEMFVWDKNLKPLTNCKTINLKRVKNGTA